MPLLQVRRSAGAAPRDLTAFLPTTREEMRARGWDALDILIVNGDAYVDHPAFGAAIIGRFLEGRGFRVGIISQPRYQDPSDLLRMGVPRLMVGVTAGIGMLVYATMQGEAQPLVLAMVVMVSMIVACTVASIAGALIPLTLKKLGADPATASSIFLTTASDVASMGIFLSLATVLLM